METPWNMSFDADCPRNFPLNLQKRPTDLPILKELHTKRIRKIVSDYRAKPPFVKDYVRRPPKQYFQKRPSYLQRVRINDSRRIISNSPSRRLNPIRSHKQREKQNPMVNSTKLDPLGDVGESQQSVTFDFGHRQLSPRPPPQETPSLQRLKRIIARKNKSPDTSIDATEQTQTYDYSGEIDYPYDNPSLTIGDMLARLQKCIPVNLESKIKKENSSNNF